MPDVPIKRLDAELPLPAYAHPGDAGADLVARDEVTIAPAGGRAVIPTGIALAIPEGYAGFVLPRSGLALRHGITCLNTPGLVDAAQKVGGMGTGTGTGPSRTPCTEGIASRSW